MTPDQKADAAKAVAFARRVLQLAAREQRARKMTDRAAVAGLIDAAAHIMQGAGCTAIETPRAVVATAMARLREMRREAQLRVGTANHVQLTQPRNRI